MRIETFILKKKTRTGTKPGSLRSLLCIIRNVKMKEPILEPYKLKHLEMDPKSESQFGKKMGKET